MSEWHTPTDRAATSTSSSAICGTGQLGHLGHALLLVLQRLHASS